jgi:hypothetical protein
MLVEIVLKIISQEWTVNVIDFQPNTILEQAIYVQGLAD